MVDGPQESSVGTLFDSVHSQQSAGFDKEGELTVSPPRKQYSREAKLAAIQYAKFTWRQMPDRSLVPISKYQVAKVLGITPIILKNWIGNERLILNVQKHSRYYITTRPVKYPSIENPLYTLFESACFQGRIITYRWFLRYTKSLYHELYPEYYIRDIRSGR
jgi:hypothetical protein